VPQGEPYNVRLTPDLETAIRRVERAQTRANHFDIGFVDARIDAGADEERARRLAQLDASIARGIADADAGRVHPADRVFGELRQRIRQKVDSRGR